MESADSLLRDRKNKEVRALPKSNIYGFMDFGQNE